MPLTPEQKLERGNKRNPYNMHNNIKVVSFAKDTCTVEAQITPTSLNPWGIINGGLIFTMCDTACGVAVGGGVTLSGTIHYLKSAKGKVLRAVANVIRSGNTIAFVECRVFNEKSEVIATSTFDFFQNGKTVAKLEAEADRKQEEKERREALLKSAQA